MTTLPTRDEYIAEANAQFDRLMPRWSDAPSPRKVLDGAVRRRCNAWSLAALICALMRPVITLGLLPVAIPLAAALASVAYLMDASEMLERWCLRRWAMAQAARDYDAGKGAGQ